MIIVNPAQSCALKSPASPHRDGRIREARVYCLRHSVRGIGQQQVIKRATASSLEGRGKSDMTAMDLGIEWWEDVANIRSGWGGDLQQWLE